jgi:hypothetical protein
MDSVQAFKAVQETHWGNFFDYVMPAAKHGAYNSAAFHTFGTL